METKQCSRCEAFKLLDEFDANRRQCRQCRRDLRKRRYWQNPELEKARAREQYRLNPEVKRRYYLRNRTEILAKTARRYKEQQKRIHGD